jgi:hypothetical protein
MAYGKRVTYTMSTNPVTPATGTINNINQNVLLKGAVNSANASK